MPQCFTTRPQEKTISFPPNLSSRRPLIWRTRSSQDLLVHHGHHFGQVVHAFCNVQTLIANGLQAMSDNTSKESLPAASVFYYSTFWMTSDYAAVKEKSAPFSVSPFESCTA